MAKARRLILVPQLPVVGRYQEWWPVAMKARLGPYFDSVKVLGHPIAYPVTAVADSSGFSNPGLAIRNELEQAEEYLALNPGPDDTLLHLDLSFPGFFHQVLFYKKPGRAVVFCHASALNHLDYFAFDWRRKWCQERAAGSLYDLVLVASEYHQNKLWEEGGVESVTLGCLPMPPEGYLPPKRHNTPFRMHQFCTTARSCPQKVDEEVLKELGKICPVVERGNSSYYQFLDQCKCLVVTSKEETYGYGPYDAWSRGCVPIMPRRCSYPELWPDEVLYDPDQSPEAQAIEIFQISQRVTSVEPKNKDLIPKFYDLLAGQLLGRQ